MRLNLKYSSGKRVGFLAKVIVLTLSILLAGYLFPDNYINIKSVPSAILVSVVIALLNTFLRPILIVLTLPFTIFSMGLFLLFINAFIVYLAAKIIPGVEIESFWWALLFSIVITIINSFLGTFEKFMNRNADDDNDFQNLSEKEDSHFDDYDDVTDEVNK